MNSVEKTFQRLVKKVIGGFLRQRFRGEIYDYARNIWLGSGYLLPEDNLCRNCRERGLASCRHFEIDTCRQLIGPFKALLDPNVDRVMLLKAVQTLGSLVWDLMLHFLIVHSPFMRIKIFIDSDEKARKYCDERLMPTLRANPDISPLIPFGADRHDATKTEIHFTNGKSIIICGLNDSNASSLSADLVVIDEGWEHGADGLMQKAIDRTKQAKATGNFKVFIVGQAGNKDEDQDKIWNALHVRIRGKWSCPCCGGKQTFGEHGPAILRRDDFVPLNRLQSEPHGELPLLPKPGSYAGLKVSKRPSEINSNEEMKMVAATAVLECFHCGFEIADTRSNRRLLLKTYDQEYRILGATGYYTPEHFSVGFWNPDPASETIEFKDTMHEYLVAKKADEDFKNKIPLRDFYQNRWATPWDENLIKTIRARAQEKYDIQSDWPEEWKGKRCLIIDCQYELQHFWGSVHAVSRTGKSRQLWRGLLRTFGTKDDKMPMLDGKVDVGRVDSQPPTICAVQKHFGVLDQCVFLDGAYMTNELVNECAKHGHWGRIDGERTWLCWTLLLGSAQRDFSHKEDKNFKLRHPVSDAFYEPANIRVDKQVVDVEMFYFSALQMSQMAARYRDGNSPETLFLDEQEPPVNGVYPPLSWTAQINAVTPHFEPNKRTGEAREEIWKPEKQSIPHHYFDVLKMLCTVLTVWGISGERPFTEHPTADKVSATD